MDLIRAVWRKASCSANAGNCAEGAQNLPRLIAVRDSKDPNGPKLIVTPAAWQAFTAQIRAHAFDRS